MIIEYLFSDMAKRQVLFSCQNLSCFLPSAEVIVPEGESGRFFADISTTILGIIYEKGIELNDIGIIHSDKKHMMMEKESLTMNWEYSAENRISIHQNGNTAFIHFSGTCINRAFASCRAPSIVREEKTNLKIKKAKKKRRGVSSAIPMISPSQHIVTAMRLYPRIVCLFVPQS